MPGGDGTGPMGLGPMTGRAAGYCAGYSVPGYMNPVPGRGYWGRGRGAWGGRGRRNWYWATGMPGWARASYGLPAWGMSPGASYAPTAAPFGYGVPNAYATPYPFGAPVPPQQEMDMLKGQAEYFEDVLDGIKARIQELEKSTQEQQKE